MTCHCQRCGCSMKVTVSADTTIELSYQVPNHADRAGPKINVRLGQRDPADDPWVEALAAAIRRISRKRQTCKVREAQAAAENDAFHRYRNCKESLKKSFLLVYSTAPRYLPCLRLRKSSLMQRSELGIVSSISTGIMLSSCHISSPRALLRASATTAAMDRQSFQEQKQDPPPLFVVEDQVQNAVRSNPFFDQFLKLIKKGSEKQNQSPLLLIGVKWHPGG